MTDTFFVIFQNDGKNYYKVVTKYIVMSNNCNYLVNNYDKIVTKWGIFSDKRLQSGNKPPCGYNIIQNINNIKQNINNIINILKQNFIYNNKF